MISIRSNYFKTLFQLTNRVELLLSRSIQVSAPTCIKQIEENKVGNKLIIEGKILPDPYEGRVLKTVENSESCPLCSTNLDVKHTDVLILSQFVRSDGCMLPRRVTGLCRLQQKRVATMVAMAQKAGLMSVLTPPTSKKDPKKRKEWKKFNMYFDESTIRPPKDYKPRSYVV